MAQRRAKKPASSRLPSDIKLVVNAALDKKAADVVLLDLRKTPAFTDFFIICTGGNVRQVQAIADGVEETMRQHGAKPTLTEGYDRGEWILLDYFDVIVHVFSPAKREYYGLERLWADAKRTEVTQEL